MAPEAVVTLPATFARAVISIADYQPMFVGDSQRYQDGTVYTMPSTSTLHGYAAFRREVRTPGFPLSGQFLSLDRSGTLRQHGFIAGADNVIFDHPIVCGSANMQLPRTVGGVAAFKWIGKSGTVAITLQYLGVDTATVVRTPAGTFRRCVVVREYDRLTIPDLKVDQVISKILYLGKGVREVALGDATITPLVAALRVDGRVLPRGPGGRDAIAQSDTLPDRMFPGTVRPVTMTFLNVGLLPWNPDDGFALEAIGGSDPFLPASLIPMAPGATVLPGEAITVQANFTAPMTQGTYTTRWQMEQTGSGFFGEVVTKRILVNSTGLANLSFDARDSSPAAPIQIKPGDPIALDAFVDNNGGAAAGPFWLEFWGSRTGGLTLDTFLAGSVMVPSLPAGGGFPFSGRMPLYSIPDGPYTVVFAADRLNQVVESTRRDNRGVVASRRLLVIRPLSNADLAATGFNIAPNPLLNGQPIHLYGTVKNVGSERTGPFWIEFWGSRDRVNPRLDFLLCDSIRVANLDPGSSISLNAYPRTLYNCPVGIFKAGIFIDRLDEVSERNKTNNYFFMDRNFNLPLSPSPAAEPAVEAALPDLVVAMSDVSPVAPTALAPGADVRFWARVENRGTAPSGPFWLEFWGSKLGGLSLDQFLADSILVPDVPPGTSYTITFLGRSLYSIPDGPYTVTIVADRLNQVAESNKSNNRRVVYGKRLLTIRPISEANLRVEGFAFGSVGAPLHRGQVVRPTGVVHNVGTQNSGPFWIEFWGSRNQDFPGLDFYMCDSILVPDLAPGTSVSLSAHTRAIYSGVPTGDLAVTCFADRSDLVSETNEADNYAIVRGYQIAP